MKKLEDFKGPERLEERLSFYNELLDIYLNESKYNITKHGLRYTINVYFNINDNGYISSVDAISTFTEIFEQAPDNRDINELWFSIGAIKPRIEVIQKAIEKIEKKLEYYIHIRDRLNVYLKVLELYNIEDAKDTEEGTKTGLCYALAFIHKKMFNENICYIELERGYPEIFKQATKSVGHWFPIGLRKPRIKILINAINDIRNNPEYWNSFNN